MMVAVDPENLKRDQCQPDQQVRIDSRSLSEKCLWADGLEREIAHEIKE